jgi:prepilin-type processing-associated H-X9-DG protein
MTSARLDVAPASAIGGELRLHPRWRGFSLVEIIFVIGLIAVLLSILLAVIARVRSRGRDIVCQSNLRSVVTALVNYAESNRGYYPYGFHWSRTRRPVNEARQLSDLDPAPNNGSEFVSWASQVGKFINKGQMRAPEENDGANFPLALRCPVALDVREHYLSYTMNMTIAVDPRAELKMGPPPRAQLRPPSARQLRNQTALIWDTAVFQRSSYDIDSLIGLDIDEQRFWQGAAIPQYRYYNSGDPFGHVAPGTYGNNQPVKLDVGSAVFRNIDPPDSLVGSPYQGNLRFRHSGNTVCNAGFADGHVESFTAVMNGDGTVKSHNALRKYFMILPPAGVTWDPKLPH